MKSAAPSRSVPGRDLEIYHAGDHDDRNRLADRTDDRGAVNRAWHVEIQQHEPRLMLTHGAKRTHRRLGEDHLVALALEEFSEDGTDVLLVVDDQVAVTRLTDPGVRR